MTRPAALLAGLALFALAALPALPPAEAHVESYSQSSALAVGPYLVFFEPRPTPPYANDSVTLVAQVSDNATGSLLRDVPATVIVGGPGDFAQRQEMRADGTGYLVASMILPERGNYSARLILQHKASGENHSTSAEFEVFPDLPYRIRPVDQAVDVYTGTVTPLAFEVLDSTTLAPAGGLADLRVNVEHWSDDHATFLGAEEHEATRVAAGVWRIEPRFAESGMYHMRFASEAGDFNYADVPLLHVYAISPESASVPDEMPGFTPAALALALAIALALAQARIRRR